MKSREFCYWLQGMFELTEPKALDEKQTDLVRKHLALVFKHEIDPSYGPPDHQAALNDLHGVTTPGGAPASPSKPGTALRC